MGLSEAGADLLPPALDLAVTVESAKRAADRGEKLRQEIRRELDQARLLLRARWLLAKHADEVAQKFRAE